MDSSSDSGPEIRITDLLDPVVSTEANAADTNIVGTEANAANTNVVDANAANTNVVDTNVVGKRPRDENVVEPLQFSMGLRCGDYRKKSRIQGSKGKIKTQVKARAKVKVKVAGTSSSGSSSSGSSRSSKPRHQIFNPEDDEPNPVIRESPEVRVAFYCRTLQNVNPIVARRRYSQRVHAPPPPIVFGQHASPQEILFLYPYHNTKLTSEWIAHKYLQYHRGRHIDWCMKFADMQQVRRTAAASPFQFVSDGPSPFIMTNEIVKAAQKLFDMNQQWRWAMKNLLRLWLVRKSCKRQIGHDSDIMTMEPIPEAEQCRVVCIQTRSLYVFSGTALLKSMRSNIECQVAAIPDVKTPKNPFTNIRFTFGQLLELYNQLLGWCAKKHHALPASIALFRETEFRPQLMVKLHHNYLQYRAAIASFMDDDVRGDFFIETLETVIDSYSHAMNNYSPVLMSTERFEAWFEKDRCHYLMRSWRLIVADYWYYEQTGHLAREHWRSEMCIMQDINVLMKASEPHLRQSLMP